MFIYFYGFKYENMFFNILKKSLNGKIINLNDKNKLQIGKFSFILTNH